jgi:hypothetical protein
MDEDGIGGKAALRGIQDEHAIRARDRRFRTGSAPRFDRAGKRRCHDWKSLSVDKCEDLARFSR